MPCSSTSQLTNANSVTLPGTIPTTQAQWSVFVQRLQQMLNLVGDATTKTGVNVIPPTYAVYDGAALPTLAVTGATPALDSGLSQFGNASLKLTATATTVTVEFPSGAIPIAPFTRWIESVYIQSSRTSITGTLAVVTASGSYSVNIGGTLTPAQWGRLYGDCDLTADSSTAATLLLTLTGVTVGDTFHLEAWQLEAASGQTNLPTAFNLSRAPGALGQVPDDTTYAKILASHTAGNVAYNFRGVWASATGYLIGDETVYAGSYWLCTQANTGRAPAQSSAYWQAVGAYNDYQGAWSAATAYQPGMEVTYGGNFWVCAAANTNSTPAVGNANWAMAGPQNLDKIADGTGRFAVVNGANLNAVSQVDPNKRAIIDLTQTAHIGKTLANMPDDTAANRYAVASIDPNRRALIDFTQSGHTGKVLDNINDGTTYGRPYLSRLNAGRPWIDFGETIHANKHLGNVPDDTTSGRFAVANIDGNRRALVDFTQAGHVGKVLDNLPDGTTRFAVKNGGMFGVASIDGNSRALVDFGQTGHLNKVLDNIGDGTTYGRPLLSRLNAGNPLIDFAATYHLNKNLDNIGEGTSYYRLPAGNMSGVGGRALIDFTQGHINKTLDNVGDGTTYARYLASDATGNRLDFGKALLNKHLGNIPDDATSSRFAVANIDSNHRALVDFSQSAHLNKTQDYIPAGATWGATRLSALQNGVPQWATSGKNLAPNASFASNKVGTPAGNLASGAPISDGWAVSANPAGFYVAYEQNAGGVSDVEIQLNGGTVVPANGSVTAFVQTVSPVPVKAGAPYAVTGTRGCQSNVALPAGITVASRIYAQFLFADGSSAGYSPLNEIDGNAYAPTAQTVVGTVPANAVSAIIGLQMYVTNGTASAITVGASGQIPAGIRWYNAQFVESVNLDYEAVDGTTHGRIAMQDVFQVGGVNRAGLAYPGSGQTVGDQRNLMPVTWAGVRSVLSASPITFSITSGSPNSTVNFSVAAVSLYAGSVTVSYNASSGSHAQVNGTTATYYLFYRDATGAGGSQTLYITVFPQTLAQYNDAVLIGSCNVTVASGGGGSGGTGSGGGGYCVADSMFVRDGRLAGDAEIGDPFDCIDLPTAAGKHVRALQGVTRGMEECVRMITSDGCALVCSVSTPFDLPNGHNTTALHMLGEQVITDLGTAIVTSLALVGPQPVTRANLGGVSYAAGSDPRRRIYSHNATSKP